MNITSRNNPLVHTLREIRDGKIKKSLFCEGEKLIEDLLSTKLDLEGLYHTPATKEKAIRLLNKARKPKNTMICLSEQVMDYVSDVDSPPGLIAVAARPVFQSEPKEGLLLFLHDIQLPQNVGALFRTAEATGVAMVFMTPKCGDPFNPKSIRGSAGSVLRLPSKTGVDTKEFLKSCRANNVQILAAAQKGQKNYNEVDWKRSSVLVVGSEGQGLPDDIVSMVDTAVKIPMSGRVESLNVGIAAAVCLFEAARQRSI